MYCWSNILDGRRKFKDTTRKMDEIRLKELLAQKEELENTRPRDIDAMRRWKHTMGKILEELELFKK